MPAFRSGSAHPQARPLGGKALALAWAIEVFAVSTGLLLAVYAGLEGGTSGAFGMAIAVMPFAALSVIELTKIPLVALAFGVRSLFWRLVAAAALAVVTFATFENFVFERGFTERVKQVEEADLAARTAAKAREERAEARHADLLEQQAQAAARLGVLRDEAAAAREHARQDIGDTRGDQGAGAADLRAERERIDRDLAALEARRASEVERERRRCSVHGRVAASPPSRAATAASATT